MKSWVFWVCATVAAYLIYVSWFQPEEASVDEAGAKEPPLKSAEPALPESEQPAEEKPLKKVERKPPALRVDTGADDDPDPVLDPSLERLEKWRELKRAGETARAAELESEILRNRESDAARHILRGRGMKEYAAFQRIGRNADGLRHAHQARKLLTPALFLRQARREEKEKLRGVLRELADAVVFGRRHVEGADLLYEPRRGDVLGKLCGKFFRSKGVYTSPGFVVEMNRMSSARALRAGEAIRVPRGKPSIVVLKHEYRLYYLIDGAYVRDFPVGLGKEGLTPEADFEIANRSLEPDWWPSAGVKIPHGHPDNILGTRWLGFKNTAELSGFGIHGTPDPASIGKDMSSGCIRMHKEDVERLFAWTPLKTVVSIRR